MRKRLQVLFILFFGITICVNAQSSDEDSYKYIPKAPTPEMASLGKFIETPVSLNKGIPTVDVPLFDISSGSYSLPVSLNYHAGGVNVYDVASWVGLGWKLSTEGVIMRQQRGNPDERGFFYTNSVSDYINDYNGQGARRDAYIDYAVGDYEADVFSITCGGISGKFFFQQSSQQFLDNTGQKLNINYEAANDDWIVKDAQGNTYFFKHLTGEKTDTFFSQNGQLLFDVNDRPKGSDIWRISKITTKEGRDINFEYVSNGNVNRYFSPGMVKKDININYAFNVPDPCTFTPGNLDIISQYNNEYPFSITKISFDEGYVKFVWSDTTRLDTDQQYALKALELYNLGDKLVKKYNFTYSFIASSESSTDPKYRYRMYLDRIDMQNPNLPTDIQLYRGFSYFNRNALPSRLSTSIDYWGGYNNAPEDNQLIPKGVYKFTANGVVNKLMIDGGDRRVDSIHVMDGILNKIILPTKGEINYTYENNWIKADSLDMETRIFFNKMESESFYFNKSPDYIVPNNQLKYQTKITIPENNYNVEQIISVTGNGCNASAPLGYQCDYLLYVFPDNGITPTGTTTGGTILQQSTFIPGGKYIIAAKPSDNDGVDTGDFSIELTLNNEKTFDRYLMGGVRIKTIEIKDGDAVIEKNYDYNNFGTDISSGKLQRTPSFYRVLNTVKKCRSNLGGPSTYLDFNVLKIKSSPNVPLMDDSGNSIYYTNVTEYQKDLLNPSNSIKTEYTFSYFDDTLQTLNNSDNDLPVLSFSNMRGNLLEKNIYQLENSSYKTIQNEKYRYDYIDNNIPNYSIYLKIPDEVLRTTEGEHYTLRNSNMYLMDKEITDRFNNLDVTERSTYGYNYDTKNKIQENITHSNGNRKEISTKYATEKGNTKLLAKNMLSVPLEIQTIFKKDSLDTGKMIAKTESLYNFPGDVNLSSVLKYNNQNIARTEVEMIKYDDKGNLLEYKTKNGQSVTILWGYKQTKPIAKVEGISYEDLMSLLGKSTVVTSYLTLPIVIQSDTDAYQKPGSDETALLDLLKAFRTNSHLSGYPITTYTYDPLIGVRSETPPSGVTAYYDYDDFGRLREIKDVNKDSVKEYQYHYRP